MKPSKVSYDSFNARYLTFQEVADSFIENAYFGDLSKNCHSLLMGPRGCGKTTLLKMLAPVSLSFWDEKQRSSLFDSIPFYGIYIPSDIHWKKQLDQLKLDFGDGDFALQVSKITVNVNILLSIIKTFAFLLQKVKQAKGVDYGNEKEVEVSKQLIDSWGLKKPIAPNLDCIELALLKVIVDINTEFRKKKYNKSYSINIEEYYSLDYFDLSILAFTIFEKIVNDIPVKKWAFCFDELEIAPEWLQFELLENLRSREQRILYKLTTAPIISLYKEIKEEFPLINASENNDYNVIKIWTSKQSDFSVWAKFCYQLIRSRISRQYKETILPEEILGDSDSDRLLEQSFKSVSSKAKMDFEPNSLSWHLLKDLARFDSTFKAFLIKKTINPDNPTPQNANQKNEIFRKIKQLAIYRYQFLKEGKAKRARKVVPLYFGIPFIYEFCDGNPRILISLIDNLLALFFLESNNKKVLSINEQSRVIASVSERYLSIISAHPDANITILEKNVNIKQLIEKIGDTVYFNMIEGSFTMDPTNSFVIDEELNNKLLELLELALYLGAIVYLDQGEPVSKNGIVGKRFRLSYTLSPYFGILSRTYKSQALSKLLKRANSSENQQSLF